MTLAALLRSLRERGEPVEVRELARRLVAAPDPPSPELSRRLVAAALDWREGDLPEHLAPDQLREPEARPVAEIPLERAEFAVVDLETTGLSAERAEIIEIGAVRVRSLAVADAFETLVRPRAPIPPRITRLTGIHDDMGGEAPALDAALRAFEAWWSRAPRAPFVAHNAGFDARFVEAARREIGLAPLSVPVLCTRKLGRRLVPELGRYSLDHLCAFFGYSNAARHRAAGDARVTARILVDLLQRARAEGVATLGGLLDLQARAPARRAARGLC